MIQVRNVGGEKMIGEKLFWKCFFTFCIGNYQTFYKGKKQKQKTPVKLKRD